MNKEKKITITNIADFHNGGDPVIVFKNGAINKIVSELVLDESDLLLIAGDVTGMVYSHEFGEQMMQLEKLFDFLLDNSDKFEYIVGTFGNHDSAWDWFRNPQVDLAIDQLESLVAKFNKNSKKAKIFWDVKPTKLELTFKNGMDLSIVTSPLTNKIWETDPWGFHYESHPEETLLLKELCNDGPIDIILSHMPIYGYADTLAYPQGRDHRVGTMVFNDIPHKPELFVTGHIHEAYGVYEATGTGKWPNTNFISCSVCDYDYHLSNSPIVIEFSK